MGKSHPECMMKANIQMRSYQKTSVILVCRKNILRGFDDHLIKLVKERLIASGVKVLLNEEVKKISLKNLFTFPNVLNEVNNNKLKVHGLIHDIGSGVLKYLNPKTEKFENI